jgi:hypothetical protein
MMQPDTPEQAQAQRKMDEAVNEFLVAYGWNEGVTLSWALVAHQILPPTEDGYDQSAYPVVYMGGSLPDHIAIGLFNMGLEFVHSDRYERRRDTDG